MINKSNIPVLFAGLSKCTRQTIFPYDVAKLLGYGVTQIKKYKRELESGKLDHLNARLERAAYFAVRIGETQGYESLFPLIPKLSGDLDDEECVRRHLAKARKIKTPDYCYTEEQLDLINEMRNTKTIHQLRKQFNFPDYVSNETVEQLRYADEDDIEYALTFVDKSEITVNRLLRLAIKEATA